MKRLLVVLVFVQATVFAQFERGTLDIRVGPVGESVRQFLGPDFASGRFITDSRFDSSLARRLQRALDSVRYVYNAKGVSAAMYVPGEGMWQGVSGVSTISPPDSIRPEMIFGIGSNTKAFISALALKIVEDWSIQLSDQTLLWLGPRPNINNTATIRQLLNMTAGNFDYLNDGRAAIDSINANPSRLWTPEEIINRFVGSPRFPAGTSWRCSNTNYLLTGMIIKAATNTDPCVLLRQRIINPLGLQSTFFAIQESLAAPIAHPWYQGIDIYSTPRTALYSMAGTAGAMWARATDMVQWLKALHDGQVVSQNSLDSMLTFVPCNIGLGKYLDRYEGYGLGRWRESLYGKAIYHHTGHVYGYLSAFGYEPQTRIASAILFNQSPTAPLYETEQALYMEALRNTRVTNTIPWTLYATSGHADGGRFLKVDTATASINPIGPYVYPEIINLAVHPRTHELFGIARDYLSYHIVKIDPTTGNASPVSALNIPASANVKGMTFLGDTLYVCGGLAYLYRVDVTSGSATPVSQTRRYTSGLAFHPLTGELWVSDRYNDSLFTFDLNSLLLRGVGRTGFGIATKDIAFDPRGKLYGIVGGVSDTNRLIRIDQTNGIGTVVGSFSARPILALAMSPDTVMVGVDPIANQLPTTYRLYQNYPNPFNPTTTIKYQIPSTNGQLGFGISGLVFVSLKVFDLLGREVATLVNEQKSPGTYTMQWNASGVASGVYLYRLTAGAFVETKKCLVLR